MFYEFYELEVLLNETYFLPAAAGGDWGSGLVVPPTGPWRSVCKHNRWLNYTHYNEETYMHIFHLNTKWKPQYAIKYNVQKSKVKLGLAECNSHIEIKI